MHAKRQRSIRLTDVESFLRRIQEKCPFAMMFRGQARDWPLVPRVGRYSVAKLGYDEWRVFHDHIVETFLRLGRPYFIRYPETAAEAWVVAQHHGLPTRLLDTTTNPLKALYFAVNEPKDDAERGVVWAFEYRGYRTELKDEGAEYWENEICPFLPAQYTPRLTAQEGAFILCPVPENTKPMRELNKVRQSDLSFTKVSIPKRYKAAIRRELSILGIKSRLLFPDLDGVAQGIRLGLDSLESVDSQS